MKLVYQGTNPKSGRTEWLDEDFGLIMEESKVARYRTLVEDIEERIGRKITADEARTVHWLAGWEQGTIDRIRGIIADAYANGVKRGSRK